MLTYAEIQAIPRPRSPADYVEAYRANLVEARDNLDRALVVFRRFRRDQQITERAPPETGFIFASVAAGHAYAEVVRWRSDVDHWHARKVQAEQEMRGEAVRAPGVVVVTEEEKREFVDKWKSALDARQVPEREPGEDDDE